MEIVAPRAAANSKRGDKSTLKRKYNPAQSKRYYDGLMNTVGKNLKRADLDRLVRGALKTPGHGGTMESIVQELVRGDMVNNNTPPSKDVPARYQVTYGERMGMLHEKIAGSVSALKNCRELSDSQRAELKNNLVELLKLGHSVEDGQGKWNPLRLEFNLDPEAKTFGGEFIAEPGALDSLVDQLVYGDDALDKLDQALSCKDGGAFEQVNKLLEGEMRNALFKPQSKNARISENAAKTVMSDNEVKDKDGGGSDRSGEESPRLAEKRAGQGAERPHQGAERARRAAEQPPRGKPLTRRAHVTPAAESEKGRQYYGRLV